MEKIKEEMCKEVLISLRRIIRAIDLHSRQLIQTHGVSGPQALILHQIIQAGETTAVQLAQQVHLSKPTISGILSRLEKQGLITKAESTLDRRVELLQPTDKARDLIQSAPPLLQESFVQRFHQLADYEQSMILFALQRIAELMDATKIDAATILATEHILSPEPPEDV